MSGYRLDYYDESGTLCYDPDGRLYGLPTYPWEGAPEGLATYRQLAAQGLRPGGQDPVAQLLRPGRGRRDPLIGYLYRIDQALPRRTVTAAMRAAALVAVEAKKWCGRCRQRLDYIPPQRTGECLDCADPAAA